MTSGGFLSQRLYVPKLIWHQKASVRLPAIEAKIQACNTLSQFLDRLVAQSQSGKLVLLVEIGGHVEKLEQERQKVLKELETFEQVTLDQWTKLSKKMSFIVRPGKGPGGAPGAGANGMSANNAGYRPMHHYQHGDYQYTPYHQHRPPHHHQDDSGGPYDWLKNDDPVSVILKPESMSPTSSGTMSGGAMSAGLMTSSTLTSSSISDKGGSGANNVNNSNKRATSDLMSQWKSFSKTVQKAVVNEKMYGFVDLFFFFFAPEGGGEKERVRVSLSALLTFFFFFLLCNIVRTRHHIPRP